MSSATSSVGSVLILQSRYTLTRPFSLTDGCVKAGVKRFAPSEWVVKKFDHMFWYNFKLDARSYLAEVRPTSTNSCR